MADSKKTQRIIGLRVHNLRSFRHFSCSFDPHINEIIGQNGKGKTTLLEAIFLLISGSSFRTNFTKELIHHSERAFSVEALFEKEGYQNELKFIFDGAKRQVVYNQHPCSSHLLLGLINGVVCTASDSLLIRGAPAVRRRFLDLQIAQASPLYVHHYTRYMRALKQRNALLRSKNSATLSVWEKELAASGAHIVIERRRVIHALHDSVDRFFRSFVNDFPGKISLSEISGFPEEVSNEQLREFMEREFVRKRHQEMAYGQTLVGPHRHDFSITVNEKSCRDFASEGEIRVLAIALRFAEWNLLFDNIGERPIFLVDDLRAHLDATRMEKVFTFLKNLGQVVITGQEELFNDTQKQVVLLK